MNDLMMMAFLEELEKVSEISGEPVPLSTVSFDAKMQKKLKKKLAPLAPKIEDVDPAEAQAPGEPKGLYGNDEPSGDLPAWKGASIAGLCKEAFNKAIVESITPDAHRLARRFAEKYRTRGAERLAEDMLDLSTIKRPVALAPVTPRPQPLSNKAVSFIQRMRERLGGTVLP